LLQRFSTQWVSSLRRPRTLPDKLLLDLPECFLFEFLPNVGCSPTPFLVTFPFSEPTPPPTPVVPPRPKRAFFFYCSITSVGPFAFLVSKPTPNLAGCTSFPRLGRCPPGAPPPGGKICFFPCTVSPTFAFLLAEPERLVFY